MQEEINLKTESEKPTEDPTINFVKAIDEKEGKIEVFIVEENLDGETEEDIELLALKTKDTKNLQNSKFNVQNLQKKRCTMCNESGISHRILINSEEDKRHCEPQIKNLIQKFGHFKREKSYLRRTFSQFFLKFKI